MKRDKKIDFKYNLKIYWELIGKYKWLAFWAFFLYAVLQASLVVEKLLLKYLVDYGTDFAAGSIAVAVFTNVIIVVALVFFGIVIMRALFNWFSAQLLISLTSRTMQDLKLRFFYHLMGLSHQFHTSTKTGKMISRLIRGSNAIDRLTDILIYNFLPLVIQVVAIIFTIAVFEPASTIAVIVVVLVFLIYSLIMQHFQQFANIKFINAEDTEKANIADMLTNIDSIKYFGKEVVVKGRFRKLTNKTKFLQVKFWNFFKWTGAGQGLILGLGTILILYFPLVGILRGTSTLGTFVLVSSAYGAIVGSLYSFIHGVRGFYRTMADLEVLFEYNRLENDIKDKHHAKNLRITRGEIEFKDVTFAYPKRKTLFKDFNLSVKRNQKVALVGRSGSGKSTLIKLLYRLYDVHGGRILIDGKDITDFKQESLRSELSIVPQECILFDDTIFNNIAFSKPGASKDEIWKAIKAAQLEDLIMKLPKKEKTIVGERGVKLSGGEKQRVSIARAILADKKILVLDEATSAMDSETEAAIQKALANLMKGRTTIIVAHRLSTIMKSDKIIVFENGEIVQSGRHNELIKEKGQYKKLWNLQKGGYLE